MSSRYSEVKQHFSVEDNLISHVRSMELQMLRLKHQSKKHSKDVTNCVVVFDLANLNMKPDFAAISYGESCFSYIIQCMSTKKKKNGICINFLFPSHH